MKKVYKKSEIEELNELPLEVINSITETVQILADNYGEDNKINKIL